MNHQIKPALAGPPGTDGIWTFVFIDMIVFLLLFLVYLSEMVRLPEIFAAGQSQLITLYGLVNALLLITSSLAVAEAVHAAREGQGAIVQRKLAFALLLGAMFSANKLIEFGGKFSDGLSPASSVFFSFYFIITGLHFLHVLGGMVFLAHCTARARAEAGREAYIRKIENTGLYWHFVDLLWLFIFPLVYLTGGR
jgi:nitric oxide reductase NorE protein